MEPIPSGLAPLYYFRMPEFGEEWPNYVGQLGLGPEHVPELIRIASDPTFYEEGSGDHGYYVTIHARRALGQLRDVSAARPLLDAMDRFGEHDDFWTDETSEILAMMGPAAIPEIVAKLQDESAEEFTRVTCVTALEKLAEQYPEHREACVAPMVRQLSMNDPRIPWVNGHIVSTLAALKVEEALPTIERAFEAGVVEPFVTGSLEWVKHDMGLGPEPSGPRYDVGLPPEFFARAGGLFTTTHDIEHHRARPDPEKLKKKHKAEKQARKRNRRRK
jgi:hypothetical protein